MRRGEHVGAEIGDHLAGGIEMEDRRPVRAQRVCFSQRSKAHMLLPVAAIDRDTERGAPVAARRQLAQPSSSRYGLGAALDRIDLRGRRGHTRGGEPAATAPCQRAAYWSFKPHDASPLMCLLGNVRFASWSFFFQLDNAASTARPWSVITMREPLRSINPFDDGPRSRSRR